MKVSVIIPVERIGTYVCEAVAHLHRDFPECEVLVVPDHDEGIDLPGATIIPSWPRTVPGDKRDFAAELAAGEILAFLDDDAYPDKGWLRAALPHFRRSEVAAVGGPGVTPPSNDAYQRASGWILASVFGSGRYRYRFLPGKLQEVDDFPSMNLLVRKADFTAVGGFKSRYWPGEDSEFCSRLVAEGRRIVYEPEAVVYHHRRRVFMSHLRQQARYGLHRGHFFRTLGGNSRPLVYAVPSAFVIGLVGGPVVAAKSRVAQVAYIGSLGAYGGMLVAMGAWVWKNERDLKVVGLSMAGLAATHVAYGAAYLKGLLTPRLDH